jgi:hypothetical protein
MAKTRPTLRCPRWSGGRTVAQSVANEKEVVLVECGDLNSEQCLVGARCPWFRKIYHFDNFERIAIGFDLDSFHKGVLFSEGLGLMVMEVG